MKVWLYSGVCVCKRAIEAKLKLEPAFRPPAVFGVTCDCGRNVVLTVRS